MQKLLGAMLVIVGCLGIGISYVEREKRRIAFFYLWESIIKMFLSEISYRKQSLAFAGYEIGEKIGGKEGECLKKISERMQLCESGFVQIWKEEWNHYFNTTKLEKTEKKMIEEFVMFVGFEDEIVQLKMVEEQLEKWTDNRKSIQEGQQERERIIWTISFCIGAVIVLVLL